VPHTYLKYPLESDPGDVIANQRVREWYRRFLDAVCSVHDDVILRTTRAEVRVFWGDALLCRVVPYRELFHVQVGEGDVWEIRVRNEGGYLDTLDRVLERFLRVYAICTHEQPPVI
jgi:hypothetical protein